MAFCRIFLLIICVWLTAALAPAQEPMPTESGFSGYIEILGAFISTNSQLNTDSENKKTDSLDSSGERVNKFRPLPLGLVRYTFADIRTQLYMGFLPENVAQGLFFLEAGVRHEFKNRTNLRLSVIPVTPIEEETWEDPFVVGQNRKRTDIKSYGAKVAVETIAGSGLSLRYGWVRKNVDDEKSGEFLLSQPGAFLSLDDLDDLDRDSHFHRLTAEYMFPIRPRFRIMPILRYTRRDSEGDANRFHSLSPELSFMYFGRNLQASINLSVQSEWYDHQHPVFGKTRRDIAPRLFSILGYKDPFGFKKFRIDWFNAVSGNNSNIDFYDSTSYISALGIGYTF